MSDRQRGRWTGPLGSIIGAGLLLAATPVGFADVTIDWASIGSPGNAVDPLTGRGSVGYQYRISTTEVTNAQYVEFLNSVAASDPNGLFNPEMGTSFHGGISRAGTDGAYVYSVRAGRADSPVNFVSFLDSMRFVNWLHNGQGSGDTETGAYDIAGGLTETRNPDATYVLPTDDEWYKAAYYQRRAHGGDTDHYWLYPHSNNAAPVGGIDGNFSGTAGSVVDVGSYTANFWGLYDMGGNVWEWTETMDGHPRIVRGGAYDQGISRSASTYLSSNGVGSEFATVGFRVAMVPTPGSVGLLGVGVAAAARRRRSIR